MIGIHTKNLHFNMTNTEKHALVLFKDYTMLELKAFHASFMEKHIKKAGGATEPWEMIVLNQAIEYYRTYQKIKLDSNGLF